MKHLSLPIIFFLLALWVTTGYGEQYLFKVAASRLCTMHRPSKKIVKVKTGMQLFAADSLIIAEDGTCTLHHANGRTLELHDAGTFLVAALADRVKGPSSNISSRLKNYVVNEMGQTSGPAQVKDQHQQNMETTGSVERLSGPKITTKEVVGGLGGHLGKLGGVMKSPSEAAKKDKGPSGGSKSGSGQDVDGIPGSFPTSTSIVDPTVKLWWVPQHGVSTYNVRIVNGRGKPVLEKDVQDSSYEVQLGALKMDVENCYYWTVRPAVPMAKATKEQCLYLLSSETSRPILDTVKLLEAELGNANTGIAQAMIGRYYEEHNLLVRAEQCFRTAVKLEPKNATYAKGYAEFMRKYSNHD